MVSSKECLLLIKRIKPLFNSINPKFVLLNRWQWKASLQMRPLSSNVWPQNWSSYSRSKTAHIGSYVYMSQMWKKFPWSVLLQGKKNVEIVSKILHYKLKLCFYSIHFFLSKTNFFPIPSILICAMHFVILFEIRKFIITYT